MAGVTLRNVVKVYGGKVTAVNNVSLEIKDKEFMVFVGPSGCGKTTCLRMIAGLEEITDGTISIGERIVNDVSPKDRDIAMVFQNYALYPHMTVYDNMAFGLRLKRETAGGVWPFNSRRVYSEAEIKKRVEDAAEMLGLHSLLQRKPKELSGGQRQRVALGRAIVREPKVFLMDEPLSNLDAKLRVQTRADLIKLHRRLGITTVYVTHDQVEAMTMGDRIAVMSNGVIQQCDAPLTLYHHPANVFVAGFIGSPAMNFVPVVIEEQAGTLYANAAGAFRIELLPDHADKARPYVGKECIFGIRPEHIYDPALPNRIHAAEGNTVAADVDVLEPLGHDIEMHLKMGAHTLVAKIDSATKARVGEPITVLYDREFSHLFDKQTEQALY
jgi:multiple sugar transport system ATP-binding protein